MIRSNQQSTADKLITVAERLFAEHGGGGPSLREIGAAAGSSNRTVVQYHFGDRDGLIQAIFARRLPELEHRRAQLLANLESQHAHPDLRHLLEILFRPIAEYKDDDGRRAFAGFLRKNSAYRRKPLNRTTVHLAPVASYVTSLILAALKDIRPELLHQRLHTCTLMFLDVLAEVDNGTSIFSETEAIEEALTLSAAILDAPTAAPYKIEEGG